MNLILHLIESILIIYLGLSAVYFLIFSLASFLYNGNQTQKSNTKYNVAILIPSYKEDNVIIETAQSAVLHQSNRAYTNITVIADSLKKNTISLIKKNGANVIPVTFKKSTKTKSINKAVELLSNKTDFVIILDADNIMADNFIDNIINFMEEGYKVVQGQRVAKNDNNSLAILDGISEAVNNSIFREGHFTIGLSASLIGSGFVCEFKLLKELMKKASAIGGFDKELELMLLERKIRIGYAKNAIVYDEKIQINKAFVNQRRRWLSAQFIYFKRNILNGFRQLLLNGNLDYFDKLIQFAIPPRILTIGISLFFVLSHCISLLFFNDNADIFFFSWISVFLVTLFAITLAIPSRMYNKKMMKSILLLPKGFFLTIIALLKSKGANNSFIHTSHGIKNNSYEKN